MYPVEAFRVRDMAQIRAFVEQHPFATLIATGANGAYVTTHLPLLVRSWGDQIVLRGHVMRHTDHWAALQHAPNVFVCFLGPDAPVLGSWQLTPRFGGTWNYQALHLRGIVQPRDRTTLLAHLEELKNRFESSPAHRFSSLPDDYLQALAPRIECIDILATDIECMFKLSQNRCVEEFDRTAFELRRQGGRSALVAQEMSTRRALYYPDAPDCEDG